MEPLRILSFTRPFISRLDSGEVRFFDLKRRSDFGDGWLGTTMDVDTNEFRAWCEAHDVALISKTGDLT